MNRDALIQWCRLHDSLSADPGDGKDLAARLTAEGVDVAGTVARVKNSVRKAYQAQLREQAKSECHKAAARAQAAAARVAAMPIETVRSMLRALAAGTDGLLPRPAAVAFFREKSADECSDEDLRSLLSDIMAAEGNDAKPEDGTQP